MFDSPVLKKLPSRSVILETDLCGDVDDVGAIAILCADLKKYGNRLLGISVNVNGPKEAASTDSILSFCGMQSVPFCVWDGELLPEGNNGTYLDYLSSRLPKERYDSLKSTDPVTFYRSVLSGAEDSSVTLISIGFFCNMYKAFSAMPDLFAKKIDTAIAMAGAFDKPGYKEYNIVRMPVYARKFIEEYPGRIVFLASEIGDRVLTDLNSRSASENNTVVEAYRIYTKGSLKRPSWDLLTVDFAFEGENEFYRLSEPGTVTVDNDSICSFTPSPDGKHARVLLNRSIDETGRYITDKLLECI